MALDEKDLILIFAIIALVILASGIVAMVQDEGKCSSKDYQYCQACSPQGEGALFCPSRSTCASCGFG